MSNVLELYDGRIDSKNFILQITIEDYLQIARKAIDSNELQRKRIKKSNSIFNLLKEDFLKKCIIPPIVLAITDEKRVDLIEASTIKKELKSGHIIILDGLQRTLSLIELIEELKKDKKVKELQKLLESEVRIEVYVGLNRLGILYRMLTLNTGQTPMSLRHQIEMLYLSYTETDIGDIKLIRETNDKPISKLNRGEYKFNYAVEGFNAYLERNELPILKADVIENIKSLEKLSKENQNNELFSNFITTWDKFVQKMSELSNDIEFDSENCDIEKTFAKSTTHFLYKNQAISGFGASIGKLIDFDVIKDFEEIGSLIDKLVIKIDIQEYFCELNKKFSWIELNSKKIGNAQRMFFQYYFRDLFNKDTESYLNLYIALDTAFKKYKSQNF